MRGECVSLKQRPVTSSAVCYKSELAVAKAGVSQPNTSPWHSNNFTHDFSVKNIVIHQKCIAILLHWWICGRLSFQDGGHNGWAYLYTGPVHFLLWCCSWSVGSQEFLRWSCFLRIAIVFLVEAHVDAMVGFYGSTTSPRAGLWMIRMVW